ncbi:hypothetical protein OFM39_29405, partial [Escherichia coli]|nr:hypothetical protein [Escherichia coli]
EDEARVDEDYFEEGVFPELDSSRKAPPNILMSAVDASLEIGLLFARSFAELFVVPPFVRLHGKELGLAVVKGADR